MFGLMKKDESKNESQGGASIWVDDKTQRDVSTSRLTKWHKWWLSAFIGCCAILVTYLAMRHFRGMQPSDQRTKTEPSRELAEVRGAPPCIDYDPYNVVEVGG